MPATAPPDTARGITAEDAFREYPDHLTNSQLIHQIFPDLDRRLAELKERNPDLHDVISSLSMTTGFKPFFAGTADFYIMRKIYPDLQERLGTFAMMYPGMAAVLFTRLADPQNCPRL